MSELTKNQEKTLREFLHSAVVPLIEDVLVKKLGQAMSYAKEQFTEPKREWVGLTDEELETIWLDFHGSDCIADGRIVSYERAIQAKLKEKNT